MTQQHRSASSVRRAATTALRRRSSPEGRTLRLLVLLSLLMTGLMLAFPAEVPFTLLVLPMLLRHLGPKDAFELVATGRPVRLRMKARLLGNEHVAGVLRRRAARKKGKN